MSGYVAFFLRAPLPIGNPLLEREYGVCVAFGGRALPIAFGLGDIHFHALSRSVAMPKVDLGVSESLIRSHLEKAERFLKFFVLTMIDSKIALRMRVASF